MTKQSSNFTSNNHSLTYPKEKNIAFHPNKLHLQAKDILRSYPQRFSCGNIQPHHPAAIGCWDAYG